MRLTAILFIAALLLVPCMAQADISPWISYQGVLRDGSGNPVSDGSYLVTFRIYDAETGGTALWTEDQTLTATGGIINAHMGSVTPLDIEFDVPYWLGISVEGGAELVPRAALTTVPSAVHAAYADRCTEGDDDWQTSGDDIYHDVGNVGIGTTTPGVRLDVLGGSEAAARFQSSSSGSSFAVEGRNLGGTAGGFFAGTSSIWFPGAHSAVYAIAGPGYRGAQVSSQDEIALYAGSVDHIGVYGSSTNSIGVYGESVNHYSGYFTGGQGVKVDGIMSSNQLQVVNGAVAGYVLTSSSTGTATWQPAATGGDSDWTMSGANMYATPSGNVGIGTVTPSVKFNVVTGDAPCARFENDSSTHGFTVQARNYDDTAGAFFSGTSLVAYPPIPAAVFGWGGEGSRAAHFSSEGQDAVFASSANGRAIWGTSSDNYAGYFSGGGLGVYVDDQLETNEFKMQPGSATGYVLTSDGVGVGSWQPAGTGGDSDWTISGTNMYATPTGNVGIGETAPTAKLEVDGTGTAEALYVKQGSSSVGRMVNIERTLIPSAGNDIFQMTVPVGSPDNFQFIEAENGGVNKFILEGNGHVTARGGGAFSSSLLNGTVPVLSGVSAASGVADVVGVYGESEPVAGYGIGGSFEGGYRGVIGFVAPTVTGNYRGVYGVVSGGPGTNYGVYGSADGGASNYGVYGTQTGTGYAGFFDGDALVTGTFTATVKSFKIDHPLDPENKYLVHSCVESDEMMNIYNGNATLDARGEATVEMPDWFEALNQDFRYQLTAIGAPGPNLYVAEKLSGNAFRIAGGEPGSEVSWQVTGVRHDPIALANRMIVEQDKPANEVGKYMNPEVYGMPLTAGIGYHEERELAVSSGLTEAFDPNDGE